VVLCLTAPGAASASTPGFVAPADAPVVDPFRPPPEPWLPGNRGTVLATVSGDPVGSAGPGTVVFAGVVADAGWVTVAHGGGLRTAVGPIDPIAVVEGDRVSAGSTLGWATGPTHVSLRAADGTYLDPVQLWSMSGVRLVPGGDDGAPPPPAGLLGGGPGDLTALADVPGSLAGWTMAWPTRVGGSLMARAHWAVELNPMRTGLRVMGGLAGAALPRRCTPAQQQVPAPAHRRILVLVAGFGSTSAEASVDDVDARALGYGAGDVMRFSYSGGRVPDERPVSHDLRTIRQSDYGLRESQRDLRDAGSELNALLRDVARAAPGVPIDVVAHSQGGVVTRLAVTGGTIPDEVDLVATVGSPHDGADLATAATGMAGSATGSVVLAGGSLVGAPIDPSQPSLFQLSETSELTRSLAGVAMPADVRPVTVGARGDLVVPGGRTGLPGVEGVILPLDGPSAHGSLPGDPGTTRALALGRAGLPRACQSRLDSFSDVVVPELVGSGTDALGWGLTTVSGP
jgi:murein DD-endopeptidase MepM/ murein hydrolase activator NlpD